MAKLAMLMDVLMPADNTPAAHLKWRPRHVSLPGSLQQYYTMKLTTALHDVARFAKIRNS